MFNRNKFRAKVIEKGYTLNLISEKLGINSATLYRKMRGKSDFTRREIQEICTFLNLDEKAANEIFFSKSIT